MILIVAIVLTWLAAGHRVWVVLTRPGMIWRTSVCVSMIATAITFTLYRARSFLDQLAGAPNLTGLLAHAIFALGVGFLLIYLDALRWPVVSIAKITMYLTIAIAASVIMVVPWVIAPVHDRTVDDLLPMAGNLSVVVYCVVFWSYLVWALSVMAWTCLARGRLFRREDPTRFVSLLLIGISAGGGIPVLLLWSASILVRYATRDNATRLNAIGDAILPWPLRLNASGLCLFAVPYLSALVTTWWRGRQLEPLWDAMVARYPQIHLDFQESGGPLTRLQTRMKRAIIEIHDALRIATVDAASGSVESVAAGLRRSADGQTRASDLLERVDTREADLRQILALARAFQVTNHDQQPRADASYGRPCPARPRHRLARNLSPPDVVEAASGGAVRVPARVLSPLRRSADGCSTPTHRALPPGHGPAGVQHGHRHPRDHLGRRRLRTRPPHGQADDRAARPTRNHAKDITYLLNTFIGVSTRFMDRYGWRRVTGGEREATWQFCDVLGERMGIVDRSDS